MTTHRPTLGRCGGCRRKLFSPESARAGKCFECRTPLPEVRCKVDGCGLILIHGASIAARMCVECRGRMARRWTQRQRVHQSKDGAPTKSLARSELVVVAMKHDH